MAEQSPNSKKTTEELFSLLREEAAKLDGLDLNFSDCPRLRNLLNEFEYFTPTPENEQSDLTFSKTYYKGVFYKPKHENSKETSIRVTLRNNKKTIAKEKGKKALWTDSFSKFVAMLEALLALHDIDQTISPEEAEKRAEARKEKTA